ncbi:hypothetical protein L6452_02246 [Arctium lappa]|uniref:Uncharacterized protein n=1 Tax=Arctium lappa TaxID=4217 RepID=A0ACB9FIV7_ARCLA|nr:hypothetical protein L6452_02246 [Arctium lappa]
MTGNMACLQNFKRIDGGHVAFGDNPAGGKISGKGNVSKGKMTFEDVYYVEKLRYNLLSVSQVCDKKHSILFNDTECIILAPGFKVVDESMILLRTPRKDNVYFLDLESVGSDSSLNCLFSKASLDESSLWHRRMCHMNFKTMNKLVKNNLVRGLPQKVFSCDDHFVACLKGKQHKTSHKSKEINTISSPLNLLHMDLFGPRNVMSIGKKSYYLIIVDDFYRFTWVYFLRTKDETSGLIKSFVLRVENQKNLRVKVIRSDNGTEFKNNDLNNFCEEKGIERQYSAPRTPQQNGVAERRNRTLIKAARSLLADSKLPITFWAEAVNTACYVQNRVLVVKSQDKTPYELFKKKKPFIRFFKPFGCPCTILNTKTHLGKFDSKAEDGFLVGYSSQSKAYRVFNTSSRIIEKSDNVKCNENTPNQLGSGPDWLFDIDSLSNFLGFGNEHNAGTGTEKVQVQKQEFVLFPTPTADPVEFFGQEKKDTSDSKDTELAQNEEDRGEKEDQPLDSGIKGHERPCLEEDDTNDDNSSVFGGSTPEKNDSNLEAYINEEGVHQTRVQKNHPPQLVIGDINSPIITRNQSKLGGLKDIQSGLLSCFLSQDVWDLVDLPKGHRAIGTKWIFKNKKDERGIVTKNKARLVAQGVYKLKKALYGLHQAPRAWYDTLSTYLLKNDFQRGIIDKTLFIQRKKKDILIVQIYVDDIIFGSTKDQMCRDFEDLMHKRFKMSSMGELTFFLGLQVKQKKDGIFLSQSKYVQDILTKFGFSDSKPASTPMETHKQITTDLEGEDVDFHHYRSMIGSLMYLTASRPYIMFTCHGSARKNHSVHLYNRSRVYSCYKLLFTSTLDSESDAGLWWFILPVQKLLLLALFLLLISVTTAGLLILLGTMTGLEFSDEHIEVAMLQKPKQAEGFHQIVDFLKSSHIAYALTVNPTICVEQLRQFWANATIHT